MNRPRTEPMPAWLERALIDKGVLTAQGLTRRAKVMRCRRCRLPVMAGFDSSVAALDAWCDLAELSAFGEAMALVAGRWTYALHTGARMELERRDRWMIAAHPAGSVGAPIVLTAHQCGVPLPSGWLAERAAAQPFTRPAPANLPGTDFPY